MDIPISRNVEFRPSFANLYYGRCYKIVNNKNNIEFRALLNERLLDKKAVIETAIHEMLHTVAIEDGHGGKWKQYANLINNRTNYVIARLGNGILAPNPKEISCVFVETICPRCKKLYCALRSMKQSGMNLNVFALIVRNLYIKNCQKVR